MTTITQSKLKKQPTYKATVYRVDGTKEEIEIDKKKSLETLQRIVDGLIEVVYIVPLLDQLRGNFENGKDLVINEEGLLLDLPVNPWSQEVGLNSIWEAQEFRGDIVLVDGRLP